MLGRGKFGEKRKDFVAVYVGRQRDGEAKLRNHDISGGTRSKGGESRFGN